MMDFMEFSKETTRFLREFQYLHWRSEQQRENMRGRRASGEKLIQSIIIEKEKNGQEYQYL